MNIFFLILCPYQDSNLRTSLRRVVLRRVPVFTGPSHRAGIKETKGDSWLPPSIISEARYSVTPPKLATLWFLWRLDWLPTNGYRHQLCYDTICPFLTSLRVGQPWLFQPYASPDLLLWKILFRTVPYTLWAVYPLFSHLFLLCKYTN